MIAVSLPMTCAETWHTDSGMTGLTLPGMMELPGWTAGRSISPMPARGPEPSHLTSLAIFMRLTAMVLSAPLVSTMASSELCAWKWFVVSLTGTPDQFGEYLTHPARELGVDVDAGTHRCAADGEFGKVRDGALKPLDTTLDLSGIADELLAQPNGCRVLEMRPTGLDHRHELITLVLQCGFEVGHRGEEAVVDGAQGRDVNRSGDHVVGGLPDVHVVVRVHGITGTAVASQHFDSAIGDHLVCVHIGRCAGTGLEDIDNELVVVPAVCDLRCRLTDGVGKVLVEQSEIGVDLGRRELDLADSLNEGTWKAEIAYGGSSQPPSWSARRSRRPQAH